MSKYIAESYDGVFYKIRLEKDDYEPKDDELALQDEMQALLFPIPCRWNEKVKAWEYTEPNIPYTPSEGGEKPSVPIPTIEDRVSAIEAAMLSMMGVSMDV